MTVKERLIHELDQIPESFLEKLLDMIEDLQSDLQKERQDFLLASESSLKKDWLKPEEDEAWKDL